LPSASYILFKKIFGTLKKLIKRRCNGLAKDIVKQKNSMRIVNKFTPLLLIIVIILACKKIRIIGYSEYITLAYKQTFCSDFWTTGSNDSITINNVKRYFDSSELYIAGLDIKQDTNPDTCEACNCKTGKTIYVTTLDSDSLKAKYARIGFK